MNRGARRTILLLVVLAAAGAGALAAYSSRDAGPDPMQQAVADGCRRSKTAIYVGAAPNWVYVNDKDAPAGGPPPPPQWLAGTIDNAAEPAVAFRVASADDPLTHLSYDANVDVKVDPEYRFVVGANRDETTGRLHAERETGAFPSWAWGEPGDRVTMLGSWVWDCDHFEEKGEFTEFHPFRAYWLDRGPAPRSATGEVEGDLYVSTDGTLAGLQAECAHRLKGTDADFKRCVQTGSTWLSVNGRYRLSLALPPRPSPDARLAIRVVDRGSVSAPPVAASLAGGAVQVAFDVAAPEGQQVVVAKQVFARWREPAARKPVHLRVRLDSLLVRRSMDGTGAGQSTLPGQNVSPPGEWMLYWDVGGVWDQWRPLVLRARDGQRFRGRQVVDLWLPRGKPWRVFALARECDFGGPIPNGLGVQRPLVPCPATNEIGNQTGDDYPGALVKTFRSPESAPGSYRVDASLEGSSCPASNRRGCYQLAFTVSRPR